MTLPVTISGISTTIPIAGPFKASGNALYFIGVSSADATKIRAYKATDPTDAWSNVGTDPAITNAVTVDWISAWQSGDTLHVATASTPSDSTKADYYYKTFDMSSDSWTAMNEAIATGVAVNAAAGTQHGISICKRTSSGEMFVFYQSTYLYMSVLYAAVYYTRRTGTDTWTAGINAYADNVEMFGVRCIADPQNDRCYILYYENITKIYLQAFSAANVLSNTTGVSCTSALSSSIWGITGWNDSGTSRFVAADDLTGSLRLARWVGGDTISAVAVTTAFTAGRPVRIFHDGTNTGTSDVWVIYRNTSDSDLYVTQSTDDGATLGSATDVFNASIAANAAMSIDGDRHGVFDYHGNMVIPYFVNDNGILKYNHYAVRFLYYWFTATSMAAGSPVLGTPLLQENFTGDVLTAVNFTLQSPEIGASAITQIHALPPANFAIQTALGIGVGAFSQAQILEATSFAVATAIEFGAPALTIIVSLTAPNFEIATALDIGQSALTQVHTLTANEAAAGVPVVDASALTQEHVLAADEAVTGAPIIDAGVFGQQHTLGAEPATAGAPVVGTPALYVLVPLLTDELVVGLPSIGDGALTQTHVLVAVGFDNPVPITDAAIISQQHVLAAEGFVVAVPVFGAPELQAFAGHDIIPDADALVINPPVLGEGALLQEHVFTAELLTTGPPVEDQVAISQAHVFTGLGFDLSPSVIDASTLTINTHVLEAVGFAVDVPVVGASALGKVLAAISTTAGLPVVGASTLSKTLTAITASAGIPILGASALGKVLSATSLPGIAPIIGAGTLQQLHVLSAPNITTQVPGIDAATMGVEGIMSAVPITVTPPTLGEAALTQLHVLAVDGIVVGEPVVGQTAIGQAHALDPVSLTAMPPDVGIATLGVAGIMSAIPITVGAITIGQPAFTQTHTLAATGLTVSPPIIGASVLGKVLAANGLTVVSPVIGSIELRKSLTATGLAVISPVIGAAALGKVLSAVGETVTPPVVGVGTAHQAHSLTAPNVLAMTPVIDTATMGVEGIMSAVPIAVTAPAFTVTALTQRHVLTPIGKVVSAPSIGAVAFGQHHALIASAIVVGVPSIGAGAAAVTVYPAAVELAVLAPVFSTPQLWTQTGAAPLVVGSPALGNPPLGQHHYLTPAALIVSSPVLGRPRFIFGINIVPIGLTISSPVCTAPYLVWHRISATFEGRQQVPTWEGRAKVWPPV